MVSSDEAHDGYYEDDISSSSIHSVTTEYGQRPLTGTLFDKQDHLDAAPDTVLAMVLDVMVKSRPISHDLSRRALAHLIEEGYHHIDILSSTTWEERTNVLREGGYNRYREQCATNLGTLANMVSKGYDGDLNNLLHAAHGDREKVRELMKEIKGVGDLGVELFFNDVQSIWPSIAPFLDSRSLKTADEIGIGRDLDAIYGALGREPEDMTRLANGLSKVRLEKKQV
ncbi:uncharacterized protein N7483_010620 [Penicillium malachiteum]|uniref:uncharacterized protein n=1 Tax=Penicillium malachiteum TaxID=1324776 RepID=UPI0025472EB3|nr:uncharacterized protein N7483_010620 [Penicillium malachiteum]KAJ5713439.1 hypothetical protein N7483_010620 [Penicillium malachiteum]